MTKITTEIFKEMVKELVGDEYTVLGEYKTKKTAILMRHNICGYEWEIRPDKFLEGRRCRNCSSRVNAYTFAKDFKEKYGSEFKLVSEFKGIHEMVLIEHNCDECNHHVFEREANYIRNRVDTLTCPECSKFIKPIKVIKENKLDRINKKEIKETEQQSEIVIDFSSDKEYISDIKDFILTLNKDIKLEENASLNNGSDRADIYLPDNKVAFDFVGFTTHTEKLTGGRSYHLNKTERCLENGVRLFQIFEDEWRDKSIITKSKITHILKLNNKEKIYARKCTIKELKTNKWTKEKNIFLDKNHIQGKDSSAVKLGLFYGDKLVSVMTFCKPRKSLGQRGQNNHDYELSRFASDIDYCVVGGFSKLFKYFERNYKWNSLITYADKRWSDGNVYLKNGWKNTHDSRPNYWYIKDGVKYHRYTFRKTALPTLIPEFYDINLTETKMMDNAGYDRIWDCGNMVFKYERK